MISHRTSTVARSVHERLSIFNRSKDTEMLSEKAKGKQRAVDLPTDTQAGPSRSPGSADEPATRELVIRFTEGAPDLTVSVGKEDTVRNVKRTVRLSII